MYRDIIVEKVIPSALEKMAPFFPTTNTRRTMRQCPWERHVVGTQQDNPNTHFKDDDEQWLAAAKMTSPDIRFELRQQPTRSPDTNVLDLGFFAALQASYWKLKQAQSIEGLIENVQQAFDNCSPKLIDNILISHQACLDEIIKRNGDNDYNLPHLSKNKQRRSGNFLTSLQVSEEALTVINRHRLL